MGRDSGRGMFAGERGGSAGEGWVCGWTTAAVEGSRAGSGGGAGDGVRVLLSGLSPLLVGPTTGWSGRLRPWLRLGRGGGVTAGEGLWAAMAG